VKLHFEITFCGLHTFHEISLKDDSLAGVHVVQVMKAVNPVCWGSLQAVATLSWCGTLHRRVQWVVSMETTAKYIIQPWVKICLVCCY